jgi:prepilin-type processing-associated H-X9-DG protein
MSLVAADRNLQYHYYPLQTVIGPFCLEYHTVPNVQWKWLSGLHSPKGNVAWADGHVEEVNSVTLADSIDLIVPWPSLEGPGGSQSTGPTSVGIPENSPSSPQSPGYTPQIGSPYPGNGGGHPSQTNSTGSPAPGHGGRPQTNMIGAPANVPTTLPAQFIPPVPFAQAMMANQASSAAGAPSQSKPASQYTGNGPLHGSAGGAASVSGGDFDSQAGTNSYSTNVTEVVVTTTNVSEVQGSMSTFDRKVVRTFQKTFCWLYGLLLLLILLYLIRRYLLRSLEEKEKENRKKRAGSEGGKRN